MSRTTARKNAFYLLFQTEFSDESEFESVSKIFFEENSSILSEDKAFILEEVTGVKEHLTEIDAAISGAAKGWTIDRMSKVDLSILRLAVYEMKYAEGVPSGVAVNEAIELAKKYSSNEAPSFINGILGKLIK